MGASERSRLELPEPVPVWIMWDWSSAGGSPTVRRPGLLLEWRSVEVPRGLRWEGLVAHASGGGELPWSLHLEWLRAENLRPILG